MKNSFEWKKDIEDKVSQKREQIAYRNARIRSLSAVSFAVLLCACCSVAVVRFSRINQPPVTAGNDITSTSPDKYDVLKDTMGDSLAAAGDTDAVGTELPSYTAADLITGSDTNAEPPYEITGGVTYVPSTESVVTGKDVEDYPVTTGVDVYPETTAPPSQSGAFRFAKKIISQAFPEKLQFPNAYEYEKTFAMALEYYGLTDFNIPPSLRCNVEYRIDYADRYTFLADGDGGELSRIIVRDDITVYYVSDQPGVCYQLSIGKVTVPYDWVFTTADNSSFEYRDITVRCGYLNADGTKAEMIVADYEYNGIKFRFTGHNVIEKEFISCLYNVIDCLFRR